MSNRTRRVLFGAWAALAACAFAHAQDDPTGLQRMVLVDAARSLHDPDPVVRGEAALVVAAASDPQFHTTMLATARDPDDAARLRGIIALGLQATPGVATVLDELLSDHKERTEPSGIAAAFALGLLPPDHAPAIISRVLSSFLQTNLRRQRDTLLALLLGMQRHEQTLQATAMRRLFDDESMRDAALRAQLLHLLLPVDRTFDGRQFRRVLERGSDEERGALLTWLAGSSTAFDVDLIAPLERIVLQNDVAELRAAALAALTRMHHLPALELAARALRSNQPVESAQGLRSVLAIGGAGMRGALDLRLREETEPVRKAALLGTFDAPPSAALADQCARLAADPMQPLPLRAAAVRLLARSESTRARPLLRDVFRATTDPATLELLAADLVQDGEVPSLGRLIDGPTDLNHQPERWQALLSAEHPAAVRQLLVGLQAPSGTPGRAAALTLWRKSRILAAPRPIAGETPTVLRSVLDA